MHQEIAIASIVSALVLSSCVATASPATSAGTPGAPTASVDAVDATSGPDVTPKPFQRSFGPEYARAAPVGPFERLDAGALLSRDRTTLTVSFVGGKAYDPTNACSIDYMAWAGQDADTLTVAVNEVDHPEQTHYPTPIPCTMEGYGYLFQLALPVPFTGSIIRDLGSGRLWVPPADRVAEPGLLPPGWRWIGVGASGFSDPEPKELSRTWVSGTPQSKGQVPYLTLVQAFGGPVTNFDGGSPTATALIHGSQVDVRRNGGGELIVQWVQGGDGLAVVVFDPGMSIDTLVAIANAVGVPSPAPGASP